MSEKPHRKLILWQKSVEFVITLYSSLKNYPREEKFGLISQLQRASISIPSNIAEGAARKTRKEYIHFLYAARGSLSEIDTQLEISFRLHYLSNEEYQFLQNKVDELSKILNGLISSLIQ
ncbi:MAG: four helix bundle protein [Candidatus Latescibacteria bacterium]|nr:four helix bundle protein [Candidatus Latescibacterota bacterium]